MRPDIIAKIHGARYDQDTEPDPDQKSQRQQHYIALLRQAAIQYGVSEQELRDALARDFHKWQQDEGLKLRR